MKKSIFVFVTVLLVAEISASPECCAVDAMRAKLAEYRQSAQTMYPDSNEVFVDWVDTGLATVSGFTSIREVSTNNWKDVVGCLSDVTSNKVERFVVLAAGVAETASEYTNRIDVLAECVLSNRISQVELRFYKVNCARAHPAATRVLIRDFDIPCVSNLIMKLYAAGGYPEGVSDIFSGAARRLCEEWDDPEW